MGQQTSFAYLEYILKKLKKFAFLEKISKFGFNARSIAVFIKSSKFYTGVFLCIQTFLKGLQKFCIQKRIFEPHYCTSTLL